MRKTTLFVLFILNGLSVLAQGFFTSEGNTYSDETKAKDISYLDTKRKSQPKDEVRTDLTCYIHYTNSQGLRDSSRLITNTNFSVPVDTTQDISFSVYDADGKKMRIDKHRFRSSCSMGNINQVFEEGGTLKLYKQLPFIWNCNLWIIDLRVADEKGSYQLLIIQNGDWRSL